MAFTAGTRLAWLGLAAVAFAAAVTIVLQCVDEHTFIPDHAGEAAPDWQNAPTGVLPAHHQVARLPPHRSPEDDVAIDSLAVLCRHPTPSMQNAAIRLTLTRFLRHRLVASEYNSYLERKRSRGENRCHEGARPDSDQFYQELSVLEKHGWGRESEEVELGEDLRSALGRHNVPVGTWLGIMDGYEGWLKDWRRKDGKQARQEGNALLR